jgi:acid phosphatase class B
MRRIVMLSALALCGCVNWGVNADTEKARAIQTATNVCALKNENAKVINVVQDDGGGSEWHTTINYNCVPR